MVNLKFDIAFSYSREDSGIALDLHKLIARAGLEIYRYDDDPDRAAGPAADRLSEIYRDSRLNVVLWSNSYKSASSKSLVGRERGWIIDRHVKTGDAETLFLVRTDGTPPSPELASMLYHDLRQCGVLRVSRLITQRIGQLTAIYARGIGVSHPKGTEAERDQLRRCHFTINPNYQLDPRGRWDLLGDVLVRFPNPLRTLDVYLIPSGECSPLLRHPGNLMSDPELLRLKRKATEEFVQRQGAEPVEGFWFALRRGENAVATVYAPAYDAALNGSLS